MHRVEFECTAPTFGRAKTVHGLGRRDATAIDIIRKRQFMVSSKANFITGEYAGRSELSTSF
jgi:hypothetical protein